MEWDLKMPLWDFAEQERDADLSVVPVVVTRTVGGVAAPPVNIMDCSVDLKLGGFEDLGPVKRWENHPRLQQQQLPRSVMHSSATLKRPRPLNSVAQSATCLVEGCDADLRKCREYHRRHKVCEVHSKTPAVMVGGREQRFCQQCSRFHLLIEFDEVKRSCRKRLDGHNRRRRKPQTNSLNSVNLVPTHQDDDIKGKLLCGLNFSCSRFGGRHIHGPCSQYPLNYSQFPHLNQAGLEFSQTFCINIAHPRSSPPEKFVFEIHISSTKKENRSLFYQSVMQPSTTEICLELAKHLLLLLSVSLEANSSGTNEMTSHGVIPVFQSNSARSLLSSPTPTSSVNISYIADRTHMGQPLVSNLQHTDVAHHSPLAASGCKAPTGFSCPVMMEDGAIFVSDGNASNVRCHSEVEGSSDGTLQMLPFFKY